MQLTRRDILEHQQAVPWPNLRQVEQDLLLCQSMIALFNAVDPAGIIDAFQHYMDQEKSEAGRNDFIDALSIKLTDKGFLSDMTPLLRTSLIYDPKIAGEYVIQNLLMLIPEDASTPPPLAGNRMS